MVTVSTSVKTPDLAKVIQAEKDLGKRILSVSPQKIVRGVVTEHIVITK